MRHDWVKASEHEVIEQLSSLTTKSLIGLTSDAPEPRHRMQETVRLFVLERLDEGGQAGEARDRHLAFFAKKADELMNHPDPRVRSSSCAVLDADRDNLIAALRYGAHVGTATRAGRLARALQGCWDVWALRARALPDRSDVGSHGARARGCGHGHGASGRA